MTAGAAFPPRGLGEPGDDPWQDVPDWPEPDDDLPDDPVAGVPAVMAGWLDGLSGPELAAWYGELDAQPVTADPDAAWFAAGCPDAGRPAAVSVFACDESAGRLGPGPLLADLSHQAFGHGVASLPDDALVGLVQASRRLAAWQDGVQLAAVAELDARRMAAAPRPGSSRASDHVADELALALVLTSRSADLLLGLARDLTRLPAVAAALTAGTIDRARAAVFTDELAGLDGPAARMIAAAVLDRAGTLTTRQLRRALRALVLRLDPAAARKRAATARGQARVESWQESSGNGALSGRELPAADMVAADTRITAIAQALRANGTPGTLDQIRAAVFCALLAGRNPDTLLPEPATGDAGPAGAAGSAGAPGRGPFTGPGSRGPDVARPGGGCACGPASPATGPGRGPGAGTGTGAGLGPGSLAGTVHLTLPAATWLGWSDHPGELPGYGPVDGWTARDLADRLAGHPATRWHVTLTDSDGRAVAHACPRTGPPRPPRRSGPPGCGDPPGRAGPPGTGRTKSPASPSNRSPSTQSPSTGSPSAGLPGGTTRTAAGWLAGLNFTLLETSPCAHRRMTTAYRPGKVLRECVNIRHRTCGFPGCRRPAQQCDADHTTPWHNGGLTCECNLAPLCRRHHRAKQAPGWHVEQPEPGTLIWTAAHGRAYFSTPETYLT